MYQGTINLFMTFIVLGTHLACTSFVSRKKHFKFEKDKRFVNTVNLISHEIVASKGVCTAKCTMEQDCCAGSFDTTNGMCRLTQNCNPEVESSPSSVVIKGKTEIILDAVCLNNGPSDQCKDPLSTCTPFNNAFLCKCNSGYYNIGGTCSRRECRRSAAGYSYLGRINVTFGNLQCQRWDVDTPYFVNVDRNLYSAGVLEENYCRNPDLDTIGPWCYTVDPKVKWDYCDIPFCEWPPKECLESAKGVEYFGHISESNTSRVCQRWDAQNVPSDSYTEIFYLDDQENYCRNPYGLREKPWCYVGSKLEWEYCDIPIC